MNLIARTKAAAARAAVGLWSRFGGQGVSRFRMFLPGSRFDWEKEAGDPWSNSVVGLAISWLGDRFPRPIIQVSKVARNGEYAPVGRHALTDLWNRPNPHYGRRTLEKAVGLSLKVDGNAYIYKVRDNLGRVCQLWWIPHFRIYPTWPADGSKYIDGYQIYIDTDWTPVPPEDVIHIRDGIDPRNERLGIAALKSNLRELCTVNFESSYTAGILKNSGVPGLAIVPDDVQLRPMPDDAKAIKQKFTENFSLDNAGSTTVLTGKYKIVEIGFSPDKMALAVLPQNAISRLASSTGVACMSLNLPDPGKTYSNLEEANRSSWGTIVATQELVAEALRWGLLTEDIQVNGMVTKAVDPHAYIVEYDYSNVQELQESLDAVHARARDDFKGGVIMLNEAREATGFEPDPDGDRYFPGTEPVAAETGGQIDESGAPAQEIQKTALNGAQISSLVQIVTAIGMDQIPGESAKVMLQVAFPTLDQDTINRIIDPAIEHTAPELDRQLNPPPAPPAQPGLPAPAPTGNGKSLDLNGDRWRY